MGFPADLKPTYPLCRSRRPLYRTESAFISAATVGSASSWVLVAMHTQIHRAIYLRVRILQATLAQENLLGDPLKGPGKPDGNGVNPRSMHSGRTGRCR